MQQAWDKLYSGAEVLAAAIVDESSDEEGVAGSSELTDETTGSNESSKGLGWIERRLQAYEDSLNSKNAESAEGISEPAYAQNAPNPVASGDASSHLGTSSATTFMNQTGKSSQSAGPPAADPAAADGKAPQSEPMATASSSAFANAGEGVQQQGVEINHDTQRISKVAGHGRLEVTALHGPAETKRSKPTSGDEDEMRSIASMAFKEASMWKSRALDAEASLQQATERAIAAEEDAALARAGRAQAQAEARRARTLLEEIELAGTGTSTGTGTGTGPGLSESEQGSVAGRGTSGTDQVSGESGLGLPSSAPAVVEGGGGGGATGNEGPSLQSSESGKGTDRPVTASSGTRSARAHGLDSAAGQVEGNSTDQGVGQDMTVGQDQEGKPRSEELASLRQRVQQLQRSLEESRGRERALEQAVRAAAVDGRAQGAGLGSTAEVGAGGQDGTASRAMQDRLAGSLAQARAELQLTKRRLSKLEAQAAASGDAVAGVAARLRSAGSLLATAMGRSGEQAGVEALVSLCDVLCVAPDEREMILCWEQSRVSSMFGSVGGSGMKRGRRKTETTPVLSTGPSGKRQISESTAGPSPLQVPGDGVGGAAASEEAKNTTSGDDGNGDGSQESGTLAGVLAAFVRSENGIG